MEFVTNYFCPYLKNRESYLRAGDTPTIYLMFYYEDDVKRIGIQYISKILYWQNCCSLFCLFWKDGWNNTGNDLTGIGDQQIKKINKKKS